MADKEEVEQGSNYKVSNQSLKKVDDLLNRDKEDESLKKWKEQLLGNALSSSNTPNTDPRRVVFQSMTIIIEGRNEIKYTFDSKEQIDNLKNQPFTLKEGCNYKIKLNFKVQHELITGLKHVNTVFRKGIKVDKEETMIGSFAPGGHELEIPRKGWEEAPKGLLARGKYKANAKFVDDDGATHLEYDYAFAIKKDWDSKDEEDEAE